MLALTEFLLARIAEDETVARTLHPTGGKTFWQRRVSDCAAKRQIVELAISLGDDGGYRAGYMGEPRSAFGPIYPGHPSFEQVAVLTPVLRLLAAPYADHPAYNPRWAA